MSFYSDMSQYPDIMFPYLSDTGNRGHNDLLFFKGKRGGWRLYWSVCVNTVRIELVEIRFVKPFDRLRITV